MKYIAVYHYEKLRQSPEMIKAERIPYPPEELEETNGGEETFPKECSHCGSDELKFFRVEDRPKTGMLDGELNRVYKVFHVVCTRCLEEGPIEKFQ